MTDDVCSLWYNRDEVSNRSTYMIDLNREPGTTESFLTVLSKSM